MPSAADLAVAAAPFRVRLRMPFRGVTRRDGVLLRGPAGWGEFAPFADYPDARAARWLAAAVEAAFDGWPPPARDGVGVNAIVPESVDAASAAAMAAAAVAGGCRTVKVKVGGDAEHEADRLAAIRDAVGDSAAIRLDVNGGWTLAQALDVLPRLRDAARGLEYVEQPLAGLEEMAQVRSATGVPIAVDEGLRLAADPFDPDLHARIRAAADVVVLKVAPLGGVRACLALAASIGLPVVVSSAMDTSIGLAAAVALARALPQEPLDSGLGTGTLLADDLIVPTTVPVAGRLGAVPAVPDMELLAAAAARLPPADHEVWRTRLRALHPLLHPITVYRAPPAVPQNAGHA